jgi:hypothetical protein
MASTPPDIGQPTRGASTGREDHGERGNKWWTLVAVCLGTFMLLLDVTIVTVALPDIQQALNSSFSDLQWIVDAYALTLAAFLLTAGSLADMYGRRLMYLIGLVVFTCGSALCGFAASTLMLQLSRALQGAGGAIMFAVSLALLADAFRGKDRGVAFGVWGAVTGGAQLDVRPHPRIEGRPVVTGPAGVALDGDGRVAVLVAGADWRDQVRQARLAGEGRHRPQHDRGQSPALVPRRHLGRHRTDRRWPPACRPEPEGASDRRVDTGAKVLVGAVPSHRDRVALGQDRLVCGVDEHELPFGEYVVKLTPVVVELVAVLVVLGPYAVEQITEGVP